MATPQPQALLLVAQSARMLAQSAARGGFRAMVVDRFGDQDTLAAAVCYSIQADFDAPACLAEITRLCPPGGGVGLIYGSAVDTRPDWLEKLADGRALYGNTPATVRLVNDPRRFFALLDKLDISYPETRFEPPQTLAGWLLKSGCGEGGMGVRFPAENSPAGPREYYQRNLSGPACSLLFLADGVGIAPLGFNTLWTALHSHANPYLFAGAINRAELDSTQRAAVLAYARRLTRALGLVGLNSLDFMPDEDRCRVLEINPRPSATMGLYDEDYPQGLLRAHIAACQGDLSAEPVPIGLVRAFRVFYAPRALTLPAHKRLPAWCADRPPEGAHIMAHAPLCSVRAEGHDARQVLELLAAREAELLSWLGF